MSSSNICVTVEPVFTKQSYTDTDPLELFLKHTNRMRGRAFLPTHCDSINLDSIVVCYIYVIFIKKS